MKYYYIPYDGRNTGIYTAEQTHGDRYYEIGIDDDEQDENLVRMCNNLNALLNSKDENLGKHKVTIGIDDTTASFPLSDLDGYTWLLFELIKQELLRDKELEM